MKPRGFKLPGKLPATRIVGGGAKLPSARIVASNGGGGAKPAIVTHGVPVHQVALRGGGKTAKVKPLSYMMFSGRDEKPDVRGSIAKYRSYAKSMQKGQMYQGASGTWYRDGKKVYASDPGPARLQHPEAVQRAYNLRVASDIESRHRPAAAAKKAPNRASVAKALST